MRHGGTDLRERKFGHAGGESTRWGHLFRACVSWEQATVGPAGVAPWLRAAGGSAGPRGAACGLLSPSWQEIRGHSSCPTTPGA